MGKQIKRTRNTEGSVGQALIEAWDAAGGQKGDEVHKYLVKHKGSRFWDERKKRG